MILYLFFHRRDFARQTMAQAKIIPEFSFVFRVLPLATGLFIQMLISPLLQRYEITRIFNLSWFRQGDERAGLDWQYQCLSDMRDIVGQRQGTSQGLDLIFKHMCYFDENKLPCFCGRLCVFATELFRNYCFESCKDGFSQRFVLSSLPASKVA